MTACQRIVGLLLVLAALLAACNPALNWRQTELHALTTLMPCNPDRAARPMPLAGQVVEMQMAGCEAQGALYAIAYVRTTSVDAATTTRNAWRTATLANMQARSPAPQAWQPKGLQSSRVSTAALEMLTAQGSRPDGTPVQARLAWVQRGDEVYQLVVFASQLDDTLTEPFLMEIQWP